jgi:hypothetical protein
MHRCLRRHGLALGVLAIFAVAGGVAYASIPDASGVIHGCYRTSTDDQKGQLRVVEDPGNCRNNETAIQWNEQGDQGPQGLPGPPGQDGDPFSGTFTSPNGLFTLSVTNAGIELSGPSSRIRLTGGGGIELRSATGVDVVATGAVTVQAGTAVGVEAAGGATIEAGGVLSVRGSAVAVNPAAGCAPAARLGDMVSGTTIVTGSPSVCIG